MVLVVKNPPANTGDVRAVGSGRFLCKRARQPTPVFLPGESHGQRSLAGYIPWGCKESDMTERLTLSPSLSMRDKDCFLTSFFLF